MHFLKKFERIPSVTHELNQVKLLASEEERIQAFVEIIKRVEPRVLRIKKEEDPFPLLMSMFRKS